MSVVSTVKPVQLSLVLQDGVDSKGNARYKRRMVGKIKPGANEQDVYEVASDIASLQTLPFIRVEQSAQTELDNV
ncbi:DUF1659 domain-containing protein [Aneurinibacillus terranovensis]|uniref:DUF1659 domain-containing protein n=1 Tax=Aneurinibacillus terranovensis TaxID=278991 RepID=UPI00040A75BF|nr:DUF1659 domain-containing protein [Aneurinibacillus terranovensis]